MVLDADLPAPSARARERAVRLLEQRLGPSKVRTDPEVCAAWGVDESSAPGRTPDAVALCETAEDIQRTLAVAREAGVPVTPRAAGTGRTGGATTVAGGIVLSVMGMGALRDIDRKERIAVVGPGVVLADLHAAVEAEGLFYPPDPNSLAACAIGGNVAENAGGPRAFKYGVTRDYVLGLDAFLMGGQRMFLGRRTVKGVTGYDLASVVVGSEGTLAVVGDVTLRLVDKPECVVTLLAFFDSVHRAALAVSDIIASGVTPRCLELLDEETLAALRADHHALPEAARALLLIEVDGEDASCDRQTERVVGALDDAGASDVLIAREGRQRESLWAARREMSRAVRRMAEFKLSEDVVVPRTRLAALLDRVRARRDRDRVRTLSYGHAGDGNLHVNYLWDEPEERGRVEGSIEALFRDVVELGGTLSGEHGIGVTKAPYLSIEQPPELIALERQLKHLFDPDGLLNPGKIFPRGGHAPC
jgi:glycolate oxidase